jgi:hypothetical protein
MQVLQNVHVSHEPINFKRLWHMSEWSLSDSLTAMGKLAQRVLTSTLTKTIRFTQPRRRITAYENVSESSDTWPDSETVGNETWSNPSRPDTETLSQYPSGTETTRCGTAPIQTNGSTNPRHRARFDDQTEDELVTRLQPNTMDVELSPTYCIQAEIARYETSGDFAEHVPDISSACSDCGWGYGARPYPIRRFMFESHLARPVGGRALRCYKCFDAGWVIRSMADEEFLQHLELHGLYEYRY